MDVESKFMVTREWERVNWEKGTDIYTLLYIKQITRTCYIAQGTLLSTSVIVYNGKRTKTTKKREWILCRCIDITNSLYYTPETNTVNQLHSN